MKRTLSVILALVLLFAALPLTADAAETDLAGTGRSYDIWLGTMQVTDANKDDILGDGEGRARFDPSTNTLTLNNPVFKSYYKVSPSEPTGSYEAIVYAKNMNLTVKGNYDNKGDKRDKIILEGGTLTLIGSYRLSAVYSVGNLIMKNVNLNITLVDDSYVFNAIYVSGNLNFDSGSLIVRGACGHYANNSLIYAKGSIIVSQNIDYLYVYKSVDDYFHHVHGGSFVTVYGRGMYAEQNIILPNALSIIQPEIGYVDGKEICPNSETGEQQIEIKNPNNNQYNLWVGPWQVSDRNKDDILYDGGRAKYDPETKTLTLNDPMIARGDLHRIIIGGEYAGDESARIISYDDLTIKGSYHMTESGEDYGVVSAKGLLLDGDFTFMSKDIAVQGGTYLNILGYILEPEGGVVNGIRYYVCDNKGYHANTVKIEKSMEVSFDPNGGSGEMKSVRVKRGSVYTLPECTFNVPYGKTFKGWSFDGSLRQPGEKIVVNDDCTLVAIWWTPCTVSFDPNEGSGSMEPVTLEKGSSYTLPECTFTPPSGKVFSNWRVSGVYATYAPGDSITVSKDTIFTAVWKNASSGTYSISGSVTSFLSETDQITITPSKKSGDNFVAGVPQTVTGNSASYIFNDISRMSQYKLTVSKKNHIDREYTVTVLLGSKTCDLKICPIGDVNGDGKITNFDYSKVNQHVCKVAGKELTDYAFKCADVNEDGKVTNFDAGKINQHVCKVKSLFQ